MKHEAVKTGVLVEGLALARGGRVLFSDLSFAARAGDLVEVRGANGAGKTSLLRAIAGFLRPAAGRIAFDAGAEPALSVHFLGHQNAVKSALDARAHMRFWAGLLGGDAVDAALQSFGLQRIADLPARMLSQGQQRRIALARLVAAPRPVWLLDEPVAALDEEGRAQFAAALAAHRAGGGVAIMTTHDELGLSPTHTITLAPA